MVSEVVQAVLIIAQIIFQFIAVYFSFRIYDYNRLAKGWLALTVALALMGFHLVLILFVVLGYPELTGIGIILDRFLIPLMISAFLVSGLWSMYKKFESFEVVEKKIKEKLKVNEIKKSK